MCDVCTEDREATHKCMQCQQRYCSPCRRVHDSVTGCRGHTVVSLGQGEEIACGDTSESRKNERKEMCPKHPSQQVLLHCSKCDVRICFQCKLTQHEGHPTQDLVDVLAKVKASLQGTLRRVEWQMQQIDQVVLAAEDRCSKLRQQKQKTEEELKHHADTLHQWVDQTCDEAVVSVQSVTEGLVSALQGCIQQLRNTHTTLQAQRDHTIRVLKDGKDADMASLESQLNASDFDGVDLKKIEKELNTEIPAFNIKHNSTAVNVLQLRSFVGVLEPVQQSHVSMTQQTVDAEGDSITQVEDRPASVTTMHDVGKTPEPVVNGGGGGAQPADRPASAVILSDVSITEKRPPRRIIYSRNPESTPLSMCPISKGRLWIKYQAGGSGFVMMKLFDIQGQELKKINKTLDGMLVAVNEDDIVSWQHSNQLSLIKPDGTVTTHTFEFQIGNMAACAEDGQLYLREFDSPDLHEVQFAVTEKLHFSKQETAFKYYHMKFNKHGFATPKHDHLHDVSSAGQYFAFISQDTVNVYTRRACNPYNVYARYRPTSKPVLTRFCRISGQEVLLVLTEEDKVHVLDYTDGDSFLHYLDTGNLELDRACCLTTDYHRHVWIGCKGGTVVLVDL